MGGGVAEHSAESHEAPGLVLRPRSSHFSQIQDPPAAVSEPVAGPGLLPSPARIAGVDYGQKRVGLALADPLRMFAQPWTTVPPREALQALRRLQEEQGLAVVVVGWPLTPEGAEGEATERVQRFIARLRRVLGPVTVVKWDERYTSEEARAMIRRGSKPRMPGRAKGRVDAAAAAIILQEYLDQA